MSRKRSASSSSSSSSFKASKHPKTSWTRKRVLEAVLSGKNVFITGVCFVGKTTLLQEAVTRMGPSKQVLQLTSRFGSAWKGTYDFDEFFATHFRESFAMRTRKSMLARINEQTRSLLCSIDVLMIDDLEQCLPAQLQFLDTILGLVRFDAGDGKLPRVNAIRNKFPQGFGGLQLVVAGDLCYPSTDAFGWPTRLSDFCALPMWKHSFDAKVDLTHSLPADLPKLDTLKRIRFGTPRPAEKKVTPSASMRPFSSRFPITLREDGERAMLYEWDSVRVASSRLEQHQPLVAMENGLPRLCVSFAPLPLHPLPPKTHSDHVFTETPRYHASNVKLSEQWVWCGLSEVLTFARMVPGDMKTSFSYVLGNTIDTHYFPHGSRFHCKVLSKEFRAAGVPAHPISHVEARHLIGHRVESLDCMTTNVGLYYLALSKCLEANPSVRLLSLIPKPVATLLHTFHNQMEE